MTAKKQLATLTSALQHAFPHFHDSIVTPERILIIGREYLGMSHYKGPIQLDFIDQDNNKRHIVQNKNGIWIIDPDSTWEVIECKAKRWA